MTFAHSWGATGDERAARYPCDDLGFAHDDVYFRAVDVAAPPALIFRWLAQLRAAPYSYDWLDNFGRRSPATLTPGLERLALGQRAMTIFRIAGFETERSLTVALSSRLAARAMGDFCGSYLVRPAASDADDAGENGIRSRLIAKILVRYPRGPYGALLRATMPSLDLVMFRKQLLTLRAYAERDAVLARLSEAAKR